MENDSIIIREMRDGEQKALVQVARRAFQFFEALFVPTPKKAMAAECDGKLVGGIMYKYVRSAKNNIAYIDQAFVEPAYHGKGVGRKLYTETFRFLMAQGCDGITALVKDDNVGSWKLFVDNGFVRVSLIEAVKRLGIAGMAKQCVTTPLLFGIGMDFYLLMKEPVPEKRNAPLLQIVMFILANMLMTLPLWLIYLFKAPAELPTAALAYAAVLALYLLPRLVNAWIHRRSGRLRFNNCGALVTLALSFGKNLFPMNLNWYPDVYENTQAFRRRLAIPELIKWGLFALLPLLTISQSAFLYLTAQIGCAFMIYQIIPLFPFEAYGAGRIYRYNKLLWLVTAVTGLLETILLF